MSIQLSSWESWPAIFWFQLIQYRLHDFALFFISLIQNHENVSTINAQINLRGFDKTQIDILHRLYYALFLCAMCGLAHNITQFLPGPAQN